MVGGEENEKGEEKGRKRRKKRIRRGRRESMWKLGTVGFGCGVYHSNDKSRLEHIAINELPCMPEDVILCSLSYRLCPLSYTPASPGPCFPDLLFPV